MKPFFVIPLVSLLFIISCSAQSAQETRDELQYPELTFHINSGVDNADGVDEKEIIALWQDYWKSKEFQRPNGRHWDNSNQTISDQFLADLQLFFIRPGNKKIQNSILGIYPVEHDHYALKSMFTSIDTTGQIKLGYIIKVFARKKDNAYKLVSSPEYHRLILEQKKIGNINYYIHPAHTFDANKAHEMRAFNQRLAEEYNLAPIEFDYFVANYTRDITDIIGLEHTPTKYMPDQYGGMAETLNNTLYAGNNSEFYPHELVHLYNHAKFPRQHHSWVDEGIATFYGGSTGKSLDWHLQKLKLFLAEQPEYDLSDINQLSIDIPNGEHMTEFRYAIGGLVAKLIHEKEGMEGLFDMLQSGRSEDDYFSMIHEKLGVPKDKFDRFIKDQMLLF